MNMPLNNKPGPNDTGPPPVPDPWYFALKEQIKGMCLVATTWFEEIGNHIYTRQMREDIAEFQMKMNEFLTSLQYPKPASETPPLDDWGNVRTTKEEYWEYLQDEFHVLTQLADNMRTAPKRARRTRSGDEAAMLGVFEIQLDHLVSRLAAGSTSHRAPTEGVARDAAEREQVSVQSTGSGSQTAPTSAPPSTEGVALDAAGRE